MATDIEKEQQRVYDEQLKKFIKDKKANAALKAKPMAEETRFSFKDFLAEKVISVKKDHDGNVTSAKTEPDSVYNADVKRAFPNGKAPGVKVGAAAPKGTNTMPKDKTKMGVKLEAKEHDDTEEDKALIKKMVKKDALKEAEELDEVDKHSFVGKIYRKAELSKKVFATDAALRKQAENDPTTMSKDDREKHFDTIAKHGKTLKRYTKLATNESVELDEARGIKEIKAEMDRIRDAYEAQVEKLEAEAESVRKSRGFKPKEKKYEPYHEVGRSSPYNHNGAIQHESVEVVENSPFDWKGKPSVFTKKDEPQISAQGGTIHRARTTARNAETGGAKEKQAVGRPKGEYGSYKIDKAKRDDPEYKKNLSQKVMNAKKEGFAARDEFKKHMHDAIMRHQLRQAGMDPKDHEAAIAKKNPVKK